MERKSRTAALSWVYLVVVAAIVVVVNLLAFATNKRIDMTKEERFTLSKGSKNLVHEGLSQPMDVDFWVTRGTPELNTFVDDVTNLLREYEAASQQNCGPDQRRPTANEPCFKFEIKEAKTEDDRKKAEEEQLSPYPLKPKELTGPEALKGDFMGIVFRYGAGKDQIPLLAPGQADQGLEFWITNKIREVRDNADGLKQKVGVITGKEEIKLSDANLVPPEQGQHNMKGILERAFPFYEIAEVDLQNGDATIDPELKGVIVTQPGKDYTDKELRRIDEFLMRGDKSLVLFAGAVNMKSSEASMKAELNLHGLDKLLTGYGVEMKNEAVVDWGRPAQVGLRMGGRVLAVPLVGVTLAQHQAGARDEEQALDASFVGFFRMEALAFPYPSSLALHNEAQPEVEFKVIARSSKNATVDDGSEVQFDVVAALQGRGMQPKGDRGMRAIAVSGEGNFKSAFTGKDDEHIKPPNAAARARLLVVASGQFLANPLARAGNPPPMPPQMQMMGSIGGDKQLQQLSLPYAQEYLTPTILAFKNIVDWMSGDSDLVAVSAKLISSSPLTYGDLEQPVSDPNESAEEAQRKKDEYTNARESLKNKVTAAVIAVPPLLFAALGLLRWWLRSLRRKRAVVF
ncbi:MAG: GldG family protein [Myxococcales bacterium]|nr:GldG family protein [Myxococcales bacterium]